MLTVLGAFPKRGRLDRLKGVALRLRSFAEVAQVVEHGTENAGVDSSSLSLGTIPLSPPYFVPSRPIPQPSFPLFADNLLTSFGLTFPHSFGEGVGGFLRVCASCLKKLSSFIKSRA